MRATTTTATATTTTTDRGGNRDRNVGEYDEDPFLRH